MRKFYIRHEKPVKVYVFWKGKTSGQSFRITETNEFQPGFQGYWQEDEMKHFTSRISRDAVRKILGRKNFAKIPTKPIDE